MKLGAKTVLCGYLSLILCMPFFARGTDNIQFTDKNDGLIPISAKMKDSDRIEVFYTTVDGGNYLVGVRCKGKSFCTSIDTAKLDSKDREIAESLRDAIEIYRHDTPKPTKDNK